MKQRTEPGKNRLLFWECEGILAERKAAIARTEYTPKIFTDDARRFLRDAQNHGLGSQRAVELACKIAAVDRSAEVRAQHIAEAIQYEDECTSKVQ